MSTPVSKPAGVIPANSMFAVTPEPIQLANATFDVMPPAPGRFYEAQCIRWEDLTPAEKAKYNAEWDAWEAELRADRQPLLDADAGYCALLKRYNELAAIYPKLPADALADWSAEIDGVTDKLSKIMEEFNSKIYVQRLTGKTL